MKTVKLKVYIIELLRLLKNRKNYLKIVTGFYQKSNKGLYMIQNTIFYTQ